MGEVSATVTLEHVRVLNDSFGTEAQMRREFSQTRLDGTVSKQMRLAVFCILEYADAQTKSVVTAQCTEALGRKFRAYDISGEDGKQFVIIREDISKFLRLLDDTWPGEGTYSKSPKELAEQWEQARKPIPRLMAVGAMIENLRRRVPSNSASATGGYVWIKYRPETVEGTDVDATLCEQELERWLNENGEVVTSTSETLPPAPSLIGANIETLLSELSTYKNVILEGVAGSGKTHTLEALKRAYGNRTVVQVFHPSTSYEDFVIGLRPNAEAFEVVPGAFLWMCERATRDPEQDYLLFIDEINRANTARVLGDLLMVIEASKRSSVTMTLDPSMENNEYWHWKPENFRTVLTDSELHEQTELNSVQLQTTLPGKRKHLVVPPNLHILGTMNTTDRSVGTIDLALRRRFWWKSQEVLSGNQLQRVLGDERAYELASVIAWHDHVNLKLTEEVGPDAQLGHSYFFSDGATALDIARALLQQLAEIAHIFNLGTETVESFFSNDTTELPNQMRLYAHGRRLGRRFLTLPTQETSS